MDGLSIDSLGVSWDRPKHRPLPHQGIVHHCSYVAVSSDKFCRLSITGFQVDEFNGKQSLNDTICRLP
jgi:hypothetical protein